MVYEIVQYPDGEYHEHIPLYACHDCFFYVANGDMPEPLDMTYWDEADEWKASTVNEEWKDYYLVASHGDDDGEASFSWTGCEVCRRRLGGDRYSIIAMKRLSPGEELLRLSTQPEGVKNESELETN